VLLNWRVTEDHKWERGDTHWQQFTHLDPKANYIHRQAEQLLALKAGRSVVRMIYDHSTGKFRKSGEIKPSEFIVLDGLHPFYLPKMRKIIDLKFIWIRIRNLEYIGKFCVIWINEDIPKKKFWIS